MIQFKKGTYNLDKLITPYTEYGSSSIFEILLPTELRIGRNEIKIKVNSNVLLKGSDVFIDFRDSSGEPIYHKISKIANEDLTRSIIVHVYGTTSIGQGTIYISGTTSQEKVYLFVKNVPISNQVVSQPIKFLTKPTIVFKERLEAVRRFLTKRLITNYYSVGNQSVSLVSRLSPKNIEPDELSVEQKELSSVVINNSIDNNVGTSNFFEIPKYFENSIVTCKNFEFTSSLQGGMLYINNLSLPIPPAASNTSSFSNISFSASIISVINTSSIEITPPFRRVISYLDVDNNSKSITFDRFYNQTDFTMSYYEILNMSSSITTQSYAQLDLYDIEPEVGNLKSIKVSYKPLNVFGNNFQPIGTFDVGKINILSDSSSVYFDNELGLIEKPIGRFRRGKSDFHSLWATQSFGVTGSIVISNSNLIKQGIRLSYDTTRSISDFVTIKPFSSFYANENTEFEFNLNTMSETDNSHSIAQMDIYISGSNISTDNNLRAGNQRIINSGSLLGTYLGTISQKFGSLQKNSFNFINKISGNIRPILVIQSGIWNFGDIELNTRNAPGFNSNQSRIYVPLNDIESKTELNLKVEYLNESGVSSDWVTSLDRVFYQGYDNSLEKLVLSYNSSSIQTYIIDSLSTVLGPSTNIDVLIPIFRSITDNFYSASNYTVGMLYQVESMFLGITGSIGSVRNSYVWAATTQGRSAITTFDNSGAPFLFTPINISGSSNFTLGTFGPGGATSPSKTNLDSWLTVTSVGIQGDSLRIRYNFAPTGSAWRIFTTTNCKVEKYEIQY